MLLLKQRRKKHAAMSQINVVPYIDVMLVLLIIFMITAPLLTQGVKVHLPEANAKALNVKQNTPIIVSVDSEGRYYLNLADQPEVPMAADDVLTRVAAEIALNDKRPVLVKGDQAASYGYVVQAMVLLQRAGAEEVGLMTTSPANNIQPQNRKAT